MSYPGSGQFRASIADAPPDQRGLLGRLADWADTLDRDGLVRLSTYRGKTGTVSLLPWAGQRQCRAGDRLPRPESAYVQFWRGVFERRAPSSIPAVEAAGIELKQGNWPHISDELLDALTHSYKEAVGHTTGSPQA